MIGSIHQLISSFNYVNRIKICKETIVFKIRDKMDLI